MEEMIKKILEDAVWAPSGDNSQPWRFKTRDNEIEIFNIPDQDNPILNFDQSGSYIAHGGLIENISLLVAEEGYFAKISLFPDIAQPNLVARILLERGEMEIDPLSAIIKERGTNRKSYKNIPLTTEQRESILKADSSIDNTQIFLEEDKKKRQAIARAGSMMERIALENKQIHQLFFGDIIWDNDMEKAKNKGLPLKSLELPLPMRYAFRILKFWSVTNFFNKIGLSRFASFGNAQTYASSSALGIVVSNGDSREDFVRAGRAMQRVWLITAELGLSLQPVTGILFLARRVMSGNIEGISDKHAKFAKDAYAKIKELFGVEKGTIAMMFRVGHGGTPSIRSSRMPPEFL